jgi:hypothetical protein
VWATPTFMLARPHLHVNPEFGDNGPFVA